MASPLSLLTIANRAANLLAHNTWRFLVVGLFFQILPTEIAQYVLYKPIVAHQVPAYSEFYARVAANYACDLLLSGLGGLVTYRVILDRWEKSDRGFWASALVGVMSFGRAFCWTVPLAGLEYWLTDYTFFLPGVILSYVTCVFSPYCAVDRHSFAESWRSAWTMIRRHTPALLLNVFLLSGAAYGLHLSFGAVIRDWQRHSTLELRTFVYIPLWTLTETVFAAWGVSLYISIKNCLRDQPKHVAAVFD